MKKKKNIVSAFAILLIVGSGLAFKSMPWGQGTVFCLPPGTTTGRCTMNRVDFKEDPLGTVANPCAAFPNTFPHVTSGGNCVNSAATRFSATPE